MHGEIEMLNVDSVEKPLVFGLAGRSEAVRGG
jgi:hypothetical protein